VAIGDHVSQAHWPFLAVYNNSVPHDSVPVAAMADPTLSGPVKPAIDECHYRVVTLGNGLKALLVSDAQADKAAAAVDVSGAL
jgi:hypothetical protein